MWPAGKALWWAKCIKIPRDCFHQPPSQDTVGAGLAYLACDDQDGDANSSWMKLVWFGVRMLFSYRSAQAAMTVPRHCAEVGARSSTQADRVCPTQPEAIRAI